MSEKGFHSRTQAYKIGVSKEKIPCKTVEMMIDLEYCDKISHNGKDCDCKYRRWMLMVNKKGEK